MAKQLINLGTRVNDGTGDTLRIGAQKINENFTELYDSLTYNLPIASESTLGGVKIDGTSITISNGVISATAVNYTLPAATESSLGGVKVGNRLTIVDGVLSAADQSYTLPAATESSLGGVKVDNSTITISNGVISSNTSGLVSRTIVSGTSESLEPDASGNINIAGFKSYALLKIQVSSAAWVTVYTDNASRTADNTRSEIEDPLPGAGVLAEVITTDTDTILISPGIIGFNNEEVPTTSIPIKIVNKGLTATAITVEITILKLEN